MTTTTEIYDEAKFKELMLHVAARMEGDPSFGATKLNKVLYYADFFHYADHGEPITGAVYQRLRFGPAPRRLIPARQQLIDEGAAHVLVRRHLGARQERLVALRDAKLELFTATEIDMVDSVIVSLWGAAAGAVSEASHDHVGWLIAAPNEKIPYETVFISDCRELSEDDALRGKALAQELNLTAA